MIGHNSGELTSGKLRSFVERIERLNEDKAAVQLDISGTYAEAKSEGFDCKTIRQIIRERKLSHEERQEREALLETYRSALGDFANSPLGAAAISEVAS